MEDPENSCHLNSAYQNQKSLLLAESKSGTSGLGRRFEAKDLSDQHKELADHFNRNLMKGGLFVALSFVATLWLGYKLLAAVTLVVGSVFGLGASIWHYYHKSPTKKSGNLLVSKSEDLLKIPSPYFDPPSNTPVNRPEKTEKSSQVKPKMELCAKKIFGQPPSKRWSNKRANPFDPQKKLVINDGFHLH